MTVLIQNLIVIALVGAAVGYLVLHWVRRSRKMFSGRAGGTGCAGCGEGCGGESSGGNGVGRVVRPAEMVRFPPPRGP